MVQEYTTRSYVPALGGVLDRDDPPTAIVPPLPSPVGPSKGVEASPVPSISEPESA